MSFYSLFLFFFFQAEDGIRDYKVTGVQTCALPISHFVNRFLTRPSATITGGLNNPIELMSAIASMTVGGVLERFPRLRVGFLEGNCSWLPWLLWRLDEYWKMSKSGGAAQLHALPSGD